MLRRGVVALAAVGALGAAPGAAQARWGRPFELAPPGHLDVLGPQLAFSAGGAAGAAFGTEDVDTPGSAAAYLTLRSAGGRLSGPQEVPGVAQVLDLAYDRRSLQLLAGSSPAGQSCCAEVQAIGIGAGGRLGRRRTLVSGLTGTATGRLVALAGRRMLAAVATERGVWVTQSGRGGRFGPRHRLTGARQRPQSLAAAWLGRERSVVAWTAATGPAGAANSRRIAIATGSARGAPRAARTAVTVPSGHRIDEVAVAPRAGRGSVAWIESWYDRHQGYHSVVRVRDLGGHAATRTLSSGRRLASNLRFDGDTGGDQAAAWASCTSNGACATDVATRPAGASFGASRSLGAVDPAQAPALAVGPRGQVLVGWIHAGDPEAATRRAAGPFRRPVVLSHARYALNIAVAFGPRGHALTAWSQGTLNPSVVAAAGSGL